MALTGNRRLIYENLKTLGERPVSLGTLACLVGCHKRTVMRIVHDMAARGLIMVNQGRGIPNRYRIV